MPITEEPQIDERTYLVRALFEWIKDDPKSQQAYIDREQDRLAKEARREHLREIARLKRPKKPGSRPWQSAGFATRQAWLDATQPARGGADAPPADDTPITPTRREMIEARLRSRGRKG